MKPPVKLSSAPPAKPPVTSTVKLSSASPVTSPVTPMITPNVSETSITPEVIDIKGGDLTKLHNQTYTVSDKDIIQDLPSSILTICQTGKPMYDYLTIKDMSTWSDTDTDIYSDHAPVIYNINNPLTGTGNGTCGTLATSGAVSSGGGGMEGGAALENIKLITWNVGTFGGYDKSKKFYYHKFIGEQEEKKEGYRQRIENNANAIKQMMKDNDYQYMLLQEGPNSQVYTSLNKEVSSPINYRNIFTDQINLGGNYTVISSETSDKNKYSEFYLVVKNKTDGTSPTIISWGMMNVRNTAYHSNGDANTFFDKIIAKVVAKVVAKKIANYKETDIKKDCSRLWFFIDTENEQVLVSVHLSINGENTPYMHQRQQQVYILLNTIVSYFRQSSGSEPAAAYKNYNIIFSGDFNINMLQPIPTSVTDRSFFECKDVAGQKTFIYTSKHNAPSSFGGENEGKYNPTNIDFALVYPKPVPGVLSTATLTSKSTSPIPKPSTPANPNECSHDMCKKYNSKIKLEKQKVGGCHAVMLFKTKDTNKYWSLLGKEGYGDHQYMMNLIGGKIDHPYKESSDGYVCIIDNMIKEIKEESKIDLTKHSYLTSEYNFNYVFKKDSSTTNTSVNDYNVIENNISKDGSSFTNYIFYGIMGEYENEDKLKKDIIHYNTGVKNAYNNKSLPHSVREMMYLNLIDFEYDPYTSNGGKYRHDTGFTQATPPKDQTFLFTIPEIQIYPVITNMYKWENGKDYISFYAAKFFKSNDKIIFKNLTDKLKSRGPPEITKDKRATIDNFIYMQEKGMSNFKTAIDEINKGQKKTHWMWYIIPSNLDPISDNAIFFKIDTTSGGEGSLTAEQYLDNEYLRNNYIKIIVAIYNKYQEEITNLVKPTTDVNNDRIKIIKKIIGPGDKDIDYNKLINSIEIFYPLLKIKYGDVDGVSKITEFFDVLKELVPTLKLPTSSTSSVTSKATDADSSKGSLGVTTMPSYKFFSVPINNPTFYCYQAAAFQLLFSIDSIRNHASNYKDNENNISGNTLMVLKEMDTNIKNPQHPAVRKKDKQDLLAETAIVDGVKDTQQDSQEFLGAILNKLISETSIKNEITFWQAQYSFCKNSPVNFKNNNMLIEVNANDFEIDLVNGKVKTINTISYDKRKQLMDIQPQSYNKFGELIGVGGISETVMMACQSNDSNINSTIQKILDSDPYNVGITQGKGEPTTIGYLKAGSTDCPIMTQKEFIKIPEPLKYMCFYKSLLPTPNTEYTLDTCKNLTINNIKFKLRGYISHYGEIKFNKGQQTADSGHYVYVGIENDKQVLYNDGDTPDLIGDNDSRYITKGYVFLYERVVPQGGGGSNTIVSTLNPSTKSTVKANSNKKYNKRTRKHVNKITHKLKDTINTNTNKTKNKKKTRKRIHKNTVIAQ